MVAGKFIQLFVLLFMLAFVFLCVSPLAAQWRGNRFQRRAGKNSGRLAGTFWGTSASL